MPLRGRDGGIREEPGGGSEQAGWRLNSERCSHFVQLPWLALSTRAQTGLPLTFRREPKSIDVVILAGPSAIISSVAIAPAVAVAGGSVGEPQQRTRQVYFLRRLSAALRSR